MDSSITKLLNLYTSEGLEHNEVIETSYQVPISSKRGPKKIYIIPQLQLEHGDILYNYADNGDDCSTVPYGR